jgi:hypothetical protein
VRVECAPLFGRVTDALELADPARRQAEENAFPSELQGNGLSDPRAGTEYERGAPANSQVHPPAIALAPRRALWYVIPVAGTGPSSLYPRETILPKEFFRAA